MISFDAIAKEVFQILRSYDYTVKMYDDEGNQVYEPEEGRRFFAKPTPQERSRGGILVSVVDAGDNSSVRLYLGKRTDVGDVEGMLNTLRLTSTKYNMIFNVRRYDRELDPSQFATRAAVTENKSKDYAMNLLEGMYGTTRSSYLKMENARMIVRHSKKIDENIIGSRGRHIDAIFVENAQGERFLFPTRSLAPARAMTQHLNHGGSFADAVGQQIGRMAQDYSNLSQASGYIAQNAAALSESAISIRETVRSRMQEMRRCFERLSRVGGYVAECKRLEEDAVPLNEENGRKKGKVNLGKLKSLLTCEGLEVDLSESMLESVAECLDRAGHEVDEGKKEVIPDMVGVLGQRVSIDGWEKLKRGELDLSKPVEMPTELPRFLTKTSELAFKLSEVAPLCRDDTMMSFLSFVAEALQDDSATGFGAGRQLSPADTRRALRTIAMKALAAAGVQIDEGFSPKSEAVQEFSEWLDAFDTNAILSEDDDSDDMDDDSDLTEGSPYDPDSIEYGNAAQASEDACERVLEDFDVNDFLKSGYGDFEDEDDTDKTVEKSYLLKMLAKYLANEVKETYDLEDVDCDDMALNVYQETANALQEQGWTVSGTDVQEEACLSREDVLMPKNMGDDLKREVTVPMAHDPADGHEMPADAAYIDRLRTLAGQRAARYM